MKNENKKAQVIRRTLGFFTEEAAFKGTFPEFRSASVAEVNRFPLRIKNHRDFIKITVVYGGEGGI